MDNEARYAAATAGDSEAIVDWEKQADLDFNYEAIHHTLTKYWDEHQEFITEKLANKKVLFKLNGDDETALHVAAKKGHFEVCWDLIAAARRLDSTLANDIHQSDQISSFYEFVWHPNRHKDSALHLALTNAHQHIAEHLVSESTLRNGHDIKNHLGQTPVYLAVKFHYGFVIERMCECWRETAHRFVTASLIQSRKEDKMSSYSGYEEIFDKTDKNYDTVLSLSVRQLQPAVVEKILDEDPAYKNGRVRKIKDLKSLISVIPRKPERDYTYMVNLLIKSYEARKDIGHEDQTALHT